MTEPYRRRRDIAGADPWFHPVMKPNEVPFCDMSIEEYEAWVVGDIAERRRKYWKDFFTGKRLWKLWWWMDNNDWFWLVVLLSSIIVCIIAMGWWALHLLTKSLGFTEEQAWAIIALVCIHQLAFGGNKCRCK